MSSQHRDPPLNVRPNSAVREKAVAVLKAKEWTMTEFIDACLAAIVGNPKGFFAALEKYRPPEKPKGRPARASKPTR